MYSRTFDIREAREDLFTYRDILEISDRIKKVEPKKEFFKPRKDFPTAVSNFKRGAKVLFQRGVSWRFQKSGSPSPRVDDLKDVECFKCHKMGQYANKCPESKAKDEKASIKVRKILKILDLNRTRKLSRFAKSEFGTRTLRKRVRILS